MPLLLLLSGGVYSLSSLSRAISLVQHSGEVQLVLSQLLSSLVDAETGQRGYLVDGERRFLEPYERALSTWHAEMARLRALTQDNPDQQQRLDRLGRLIDKQLEELRATMAARDSGARGSDLDARMAAGKETMDDIRRVVSEMEEEERRLGHERQQAAASRWRWTLLVFFGGAFAFVSIAGAVWIQRRGAKARERLAAER
ncbi:MAG TPA: CHASE3 domain-containing protein, partial [Myxococcaceae bacterium]